MSKNFIVVPNNQQVNGCETEPAAIREASRRVQSRGSDCVLVYRLVKIVKRKEAPVEVESVSI